MVNLDALNWSRETFGNTDLGDKRRTKRLIHFAASLAQQTGKSIVKASHSPADIEAAYRLLRNKSVNVENIAEAGFAACALKAKNSDLILALEDTTSLNFGHKAVKSELGHITNSTNRRGMFAHSILLFSPQQDSIIGLAEQYRWVRKVEEYGKKANRAKVAYEDKESYKWQRASERLSQRLGATMDRVISVCDREADVYEYLKYKQSQQHRFVVRATQSRSIEQSEQRLFTFSQSLQPAGERTIQVEQKGGRSARQATLQVSFAQVTLKTPATKSGENIPLYYVCCKEEGDSNLCWHLLTSERVTTVEQAHQVIGYYERRWLIEDYHKAWKTGGTQVELLRMQSLDNLERMITILSFVAARVLQLRFIGIQGKNAPEQSSETLLSPVAWKLLWLKREKGKKLPKSPPSLYWAYTNLAKLAGWQDSKRTGRTSWATLWEGWFKLQDMVEGYELAKSLEQEM